MKYLLLVLLVYFIATSIKPVANEVKKDINTILKQDCINVKNNSFNKALNADVEIKC